MIERNNMRSSFVKVGNRRRIVTLLVLIINVLMLVAACGANVPQKEIDDTKINLSPENVARTYAESVFDGNYLLMFRCFPQAFLDNITEEDLEKFKTWEDQIGESLAINKTTLVGTSADGSVLYINDTESAMYKNLLDEIAFKANLSSNTITEVRTCEVKVFCESDGSRKYQSISVIVYESEHNWYVFEMETINV